MATSSQAFRARQLAHEILAEPRFHAPGVPRPFHGALNAIGKALESPIRAVEEALSTLVGNVPGGSDVAVGIGALLLVLVGALLATHRARRALGSARPDDVAAGAQEPDAAELERLAASAEREGRLSDAVRYRFRAGVLSLAQRRRTADARSLGNGELARLLASPDFEALALSFDEIAYGGRPASETDLRLAREAWVRVLRSARA
jgi:hypothetical protein